MSSVNKQCSHHLKYDGLSCYNLDQLKSIASDLNKNLKLGKISGKQFKILDDKKYLIKNIDNILKSCNGNQVCWLTKNFISNPEKYKNTFRPQGTKEQYDWLSTIEINNLMEQYELKHKHFKFGGAIPRDVLKIKYPLMNTNIIIKDLELRDLLDKNKYILAYIYNLDESWQSGSHWVALYCNFKTCEIYFFDSYGIRPHKDIRNMIRKLANMCYNYHYKNCSYQCEPMSVSDSFMHSENSKK